MADMEWRGDAVAVPEITDAKLMTYVPGGRYGLKLYNHPVLEMVAPPLGGDLATSDDALLYVRDGLITKLVNRSVNAYISPEDDKTVRLESTAGESLGARVVGSAACYVEEIQRGVESTPQVIRITMPKGMSGGTWTLTYETPAGVTSLISPSFAWNITSAALAAAIDYDLQEYGGYLGGSGVIVNLIAVGGGTEQRVYQVTMAGSFNGYNFTFTPNGDGLNAVGSVTCQTVQIPAELATPIQTMRTGFLTLASHNMQLYHSVIGVQFSRGGVTSRIVHNIYATVRNINSPEAWKTCIADMPNGSTIEANITAALADICGVGKVTWRIWLRDGGVTILVKWNDIGAQSPITMRFCDSYDYKDSSTPWFNGSTEVIRATGANQNEFLIMPFGSSTNEDFTVTITKGATSFTITQKDTQATLQTKWQTAFGSGNVLVYGRDIIEFTGSQGNLNQAAITYQYATTLTIVDGYGTTTIPGSTNFDAVVLCDGEPWKNEIQSVVINAKGGTFTASSNGTTFTSALAWNMSAATFQTALRGLTAIGSGNCTVTGSGTASVPFLVEYIGGKAVTDMPLLTFNIASMLGGAHPVVTTVADAVLGIQAKWNIYLDPNLNGGYIIPIVNGVFDSRVAYNGNAAAWETAIESIPSAGCTVTGEGLPFIVTFDARGPKILTLNQDQATVSVSSLIRLTLIQLASGPHHFNCPLNWASGVVPGSGDVAILRDGTSDIYEGINFRATFTVNTTTGNLVMGTDVTNVGHFVPGQKVYLSTTTTFPTATSGGGSITLSASTGYYVTGVDQATRILQLSLTKGGVAIEFTSAGTGTHTVEVVFLEVQQHMTFSGTMGLPRRIQGGMEERQRWLLAGSEKLNIGLGDTGPGSDLWNQDLGARVSVFKQYKSGESGGDAEYPTNLRASNTSTTIWVGGGGLAISPTDINSDSSTVGAVDVNRCQLLLGKVSVGSLQGLNANLEAPYGFTNRGTMIWLN